MIRSSLFFAVLIGALSVLLWALFNTPGELPSWPNSIDGFAFNPMRIHNDPAKNNYPTLKQIDSDLALLAGSAHSVRTYSVASSLGSIPRLASAHGLNVALGAWIDSDLKSNNKELAKLFQVYGSSIRNIVRIIIGNESLLRKDVTVEQLIKYLDHAHKYIKAPISTSETWHIWLDHPQLADHVDYIAVHILPYWEGISVDYAITFTKQRMEMLKAAFPDKPIVITEIGWPSRGPTREAAKASPANQAKFLRNFLKVAQQEKYTYYVLEAFDQVWKRNLEGEVGTAWGVYNAGRMEKFPHTDPVVRIPEWRTLAGICAALALVLVALLFRDSQELKGSLNN